MSPLPDAARSLDALIHDTIPLTRALGVAISAWDGQRLTMDAPLAPNVNDKGCAFGGSLASTMTLAGWSLVTLLLRRHGHDCDVFVAHSEVAYLAPVWKDFRASATLDADTDADTFLRTLATRGKARATVHCRVREHDGHADCATLLARFVAKRRETVHDTAPADAPE